MFSFKVSTKKVKIVSFFILFVVVLLQVPSLIYADNDQEAILIDYFWQQFQQLEKDQRPKIALVLGGGGARGLAHAGVLRVFDEERIPVDIIVGTSVGALIGSLYSAGVPTQKIEEMASNIAWKKLIRFRLSPRGLYSTEKMEDYIKKHVGNRRFDELKVNFACLAVDIRNGEKIIFREGPVAPAVRASATIPGLFEPIEYRHRLLVDGGIIDNVPVDVAKLMGADIVIAIDVSASTTIGNTSNIILILSQVIYIRGDLLAQEQLKKADIIIRPEVGHITVNELNRGAECVEAGVVAARKMAPSIKKIILEKVLDKLL